MGTRAPWRSQGCWASLDYPPLLAPPPMDGVGQGAAIVFDSQLEGCAVRSLPVSPWRSPGVLTLTLVVRILNASGQGHHWFNHISPQGYLFCCCCFESEVSRIGPQGVVDNALLMVGEWADCGWKHETLWLHWFTGTVDPVSCIVTWFVTPIRRCMMVY